MFTDPLSDPERLNIFTEMVNEYLSSSSSPTINTTTTTIITACNQQQQQQQQKEEEERRQLKRAMTKSRIRKRYCCMDMNLVEDSKGECVYCLSCGLCRKEPIYQLDYDYKSTSMLIVRKRFYVPTTHFKEHLRRYMGARFTNIPQQLLDDIRKQINIDDPNAYFIVRKILKRLKLMKMYKEIFTIIYLCDGHRPNITNKLYQQCIHDFQLLMKKFMEIRETEFKGRHSMPSMYMLMHLLLLENGHEPYYILPQLKSQDCRDRVLFMYREIKQQILKA